MRAMILAAGRGNRLRPLTDTMPKPLIKVLDKPLIVFHIEKLKRANIFDIVVNSAYLSDKIVDFLGDGSKFSVNIHHKVEQDGGLETAGGIINALPSLGTEFFVVNGDIFVDCEYDIFIKEKLKDEMGRLYLVKNPAHNLKGDFSIDEDGNLIYGSDYTFSGIALYKKEIFENRDICKLPLRPIFDELIKKKALKAKVINTPWFDVGTIERLQNLEDYLKDK